jgi:hypothetical protein
VLQQQQKPITPFSSPIIVFSPPLCSLSTLALITGLKAVREQRKAALNEGEGDGGKIDVQNRNTLPH